MKKIFCIIATLFLSIAAYTASAQDGGLLNIREVVSIDKNGNTVLLLFNYPQDGQNQYYLSVGHLGIGDEIIQFHIDPAFELFIKLGTTLDESVEQLQQMSDLYKSDPGTSMEATGCLALGVPNDQFETVTVTFRQVLLTKQLEFSIKRDGYIRATNIERMDFNGMMTSLKLYRKIHPNEQ